MATKKFSPIRMTASNEEAAIEQALMLVGAAREDVHIEVLQRDAKGVTVRIGPHVEGETAPVAVSEPSVEAALQSEAPLQNAPQTNQEIAAETTRDLAEEDALAHNAPAFVASETAPIEAVAESFKVEDAQADETPTTETANVEATQESAGEYSQVEQEAAPSQMNEARDSRVLADATPISEDDKTRVLELARTVLARMDLDAQVEIGAAPEGDQRADASRLYLDVDGEDVGILIGKHGQTLQAFQYILNVTANNGAQEAVRVTVDAGGYRARRADSLESMARDAADRAQRDKRPVRLEPMPAHERRVVHMILEAISGVSTSSEGRDPLRHIVVLPAGARGNGGFSGPRENGGNRGGNRGGRPESRGFRGGR